MNLNSCNKNISFLPNGGEMGGLIQQKDWSNTPIGNPDSWPQSLRTTLSIMLNSKFPMFLFWGPELICFYNDAYRPSLGNDGKHPAILGSRGEDFWQEIWSDIKPLIDNVLAGQVANWSEDQLLPIFRNNKIEDVYWTFSYSAVNDESGKPTGVFVTCSETTNKVVALKKLEESQDKLKFAINAANLGTWDLNPLTNRFIYNEQLRNWFGLIPENEVDVLTAFNSIAEIDRQKTSDAILAAMTPDSDGIYEIQHTIINPWDGKERILLAKGQVFFNENREAYRFSGVARDITEEELYKKNEAEKYLFNKTILEANPDCVKIIDVEGRISYINENGVCVLEGDNKDYFLNRKWQTMWGIEERLIIHNAIKGAFEGKTINFQASAYTLKGNLKWWDVIISGLPDKSGTIKDLLAVARDITGLKRVEKDLEESEEQLRFALEGGNLGYFDSYPQTGKLNWSAKAKEFFGLAPDTEATIEVYKKIVHPDDYEHALSVMLRALQSKNTDSYQNEFRTSSENMKWIRIIGKIKHDENGIPSRVTGIIQDITESKQVQQLLIENEERFRTLAETLPALVWATDENGQIEYASGKWEKYTGIKLNGLESWKVIVHPQDYENINQAWENSLLSGEKYKFDARLKSKNNEYRWFNVNGEPVFNSENKIVKWVGAFNDIHSEKSFAKELEKKVEERTSELQTVNEILVQQNELLSISESFNRSLTDISPNVVYIQDLITNKPIFLNQTALSLIGHPWETVNKIGNKFQSLVIHPDDMPFITEVINKVKASKKYEVFEHEYRIKNAKGSWTPFLARDVAFKRNSKNEVTQLLGIAIDVTELRRAKDVLEQKNKELENMNKELESFAYVSSHDLQEPLRKIQAFSSRLMEKEQDNLSETGKDYLRRMRAAGERMQQLIQDLLAYSRMKTTDRKFEKVNLSLIFEDIKEDVSDDLIQKNATFEILQMCNANIILFQFRQLIYNLISNSLKFSKKNVPPIIKIQCKIIRGDTLDNEKLLSEINYCHISISDNGIGFDDTYKDKIFEIFQRLHGREEYMGTGIGLAIVKKIVENHYGIITATGQLDKGAIFDIYIPAE